jgi:MtN3 and saliva related transmembrane protein
MLELIGISAAVLTSFGFVPQVIKIYRNKSAKDISVITLVQFTVGVALWFVYGLYRHDLILIVANLITLCILFVGILLYLKYR